GCWCPPRVDGPSSETQCPGELQFIGGTIMKFLTRPMFLNTLAVALAGVALVGCAISSVGAQPSEPAQTAPGAPPVGDPPGGPGVGFQDDFAARLAGNLDLPVNTVRSALQQIQP